MRHREILPDFQGYLRKRAIVPEKNIPFYAWWASRFLSFSNKTEHLPLDIRIEHFLKEIQVNKQLADWQLRQAEEAVRIYVTQFQAGNVGCLSPNTVPEKSNPASYDPEIALARMRELIRLKHLARSTERTYLEWARRFFAFKAQRGSNTTRAEDARDFLSYLAVSRNVLSSTQNQAFNALLFLFREILKIDMKGLDATIRARRGSRLPVVLSVVEVQELLGHNNVETTMIYTHVMMDMTKGPESPLDLLGGQ
jgi:integrase